MVFKIHSFLLLESVLRVDGLLQTIKGHETTNNPHPFPVANFPLGLMGKILLDPYRVPRLHNHGKSLLSRKQFLHRKSESTGVLWSEKAWNGDLSYFYVGLFPSNYRLAD